MQAGKIKGAGNSTIVIEGVNELFGCTHYIMPDRIAAATYISAAASTNGEISIHGSLTPHYATALCAYLNRWAAISMYMTGVYMLMLKSR